jgi:hypothetical protein
VSRVRFAGVGAIVLNNEGVMRYVQLRTPVVFALLILLVSSPATAQRTSGSTEDVVANAITEIKRILTPSDHGRGSVHDAQLRISLVLTNIPDPVAKRRVLQLVTDDLVGNFGDMQRLNAVVQLRPSIENRLATFQNPLSDAYASIERGGKLLKTDSHAFLGHQLAVAAMEAAEAAMIANIWKSGSRVIDRAKLELITDAVRGAILSNRDPDTIVSKIAKSVLRNELKESNAAVREGQAAILGGVKILKEKKMALESEAKKLSDEAQRFGGLVKTFLDANKKTIENNVAILKKGYTELANPRTDLVTFRANLKEISGHLEQNVALSEMAQATLFRKLLPHELDRYVAMAPSLKPIAEQITRLSDSRRSFDVAVTGYASATQQALQIATSLGVDLPPSVGSAVAKAQAFSTFATGFAANLATGNYFALASGLVGVFGGGGIPGLGAGGGPDPQIMAGLQEIQRTQQIILQKLDTIIDLQVKTLAAIREIAETIALNQKEIRERFNKVDDALAELAVNLHQLAGQQFDNCSRINDITRGFASNYAGLVPIINEQFEALKDCNAGVRAQFINWSLGDPSAVPRYFVLPDVVAAGGDVRLSPVDLREGHVDLVTFVRFALDENAANLFWQLHDPTPHVLNLHQRWLARKEAPADRLRDAPQLSAFHVPLNPAALGKAIDWLLGSYRLFDLMSQDKLVGIDGLERYLAARQTTQTEREKEDSNGYHYAHPSRLALERAITLVDVALAQQALKSGDVLLPVLNELIAKAEMRDRVLDVLAERPLLAQNLVLYQLRVNAPTVNWNGIYQKGYADKDLRVLRAMPGNLPIEPYREEPDAVEVSTLTNAHGCPAHRRFVEIPKGWTMKLSECLYIPLPSPAAFAEGLFTYTPQFEGLLQLRERLSVALADYSDEPRDGQRLDGFATDGAFAFRSLRPFLACRNVQCNTGG